jgi:phosphatidate phosphatase APP1
MSDLKKAVIEFAGLADHKLDELFFSIKKRLKLNDPLQIVSYRSYGTINRLYVKGRVLENKNIKKSANTDSLFSNLRNMYQRFESDEVPHARLKINYRGNEYYTTTDEEGYFVFDILFETPLVADALWTDIEVELIKAPLPFANRLTSATEVLIPPADAEYGIISDIDDTIIKTTATNLLAMARNVFLHNAYTRLPFAGVTEFYKALQLGRNGKRNNPFFYVSSSPWNLYDLLIDFMDLNTIPAGPLLLRDFGLQNDKSISSGHMGHKLKEIENILLTYPQLNFVLIGDSGQEDPKIYREVVKRYPNRILAIYIRDVQLPDREVIAMNVAKELVADKVEMIIVDNTIEAAHHAASIKLIYTETIPEIADDKKKDKGEMPGKVALA